MKKSEIVEELALYMHNKSINESEIIEKLKDIDDSEEVDRDGRTLLINACFYNRIEIVKFLVSQKANVNSKDKIGNTPLHAAAQEGNIEIIEILLKNGANINEKNNFGNSPLMVVRKIKEPQKTLSILLSHGADPSQKNNYGYSATDIFSLDNDFASLFQGNAE